MTYNFEGVEGTIFPFPSLASGHVVMAAARTVPVSASFLSVGHRSPLQTVGPKQERVSRQSQGRAPTVSSGSLLELMVPSPLELSQFPRLHAGPLPMKLRTIVAKAVMESPWGWSCDNGVLRHPRFGGGVRTEGDHMKRERMDG